MRFRSSFFGNLLYYLYPLKKERLINHFSIIFDGQSSSFYNNLLKAFYSHLLKSIKETVFFPLYAAYASAKFDGVEHVRASVNNQRGILILCLHMGNWELTVPAFVSKLDVVKDKLFFVRRMTTSRSLNALIKKRHLKNNIHIIDSKGAVKSTSRVLKNNDAVLIAIDGIANRRSSITSDFFGKQAYFYKLAAQLHLRHKPDILVCYTYRESNWRHKIKILPFETDNVEHENIESLTQKYVSIIEKIILKHPDQWFCWLQNRWKT